MNKLTTHVDFETVNHADFCITPVPVVKSLFDKASFYNICIQKLFINAASDKSTVIELAEKFFGGNKIIKGLIEVAKKEYNIVRKFKVPFSLLNRNDYAICQLKKFVYLVNTELVPNQVTFADNEFYAIFSSKYPMYFPVNSQVKVLKDKENEEYVTYTNQAYFYNSKTCSSTSTNTVDSICTNLINLMKGFTQEYNEFLSIANKESFLLKDRMEEELKEKERLEKLEQERVTKESDGIEVIDNKIERQVTKEEEAKDPNAQVLMFNETMVVFICKEKNENNRLEQLFLINELFTKQ